MRNKHYELWKICREEWLIENPPNHQGYYICYICGRWIPAEEITLDHIISRSRAPGKRYDKTNLAPACWSCNGLKGSKSLEAVKGHRHQNKAKDELEGLW